MRRFLFAFDAQYLSLYNGILLPSATCNALSLVFLFSPFAIRAIKLLYELIRAVITHASRSIFESGFRFALVANFLLKTLTQLVFFLHATSANYLIAGGFWIFTNSANQFFPPLFSFFLSFELICFSL